MNDTHTIKRPLWLRFLLSLLTVTLMLFLLVVISMGWLLGTSSGAKWLVETALPYAQNALPDTAQLDVQGIEAETLSSLRIGKLTLADTQGVWLEADRLSLRWMPSALLFSTVHVQELVAGRVHFIRPPQGKEPTPPQSRMETLKQLPDMLETLSQIPLKLDAVSINELALKEERFHVKGNADFISTPVQIGISLHNAQREPLISGTLAFPVSAEILAQAKITVNGLPAPLALTIDHRAAGDGHIQGQSHTMQLDADYAFSESHIAFTGVNANAGEDMRLAGEIMLDTESYTATGTLDGAITSTVPLADFGLALPPITASKGALHLQFSAPSGTQQVAATFESGKLHLDDALVAKNVTFKADMTLPEGQVNAALEATAPSYPLPLDTFALTAKGSLSAFDWQTSAKHAATRTTLDAAGKLQLADAITLTINRLKAHRQQNTLELQQPTTITYGSNEVALDKLKLALDKTATFTADATFSNKAVKADMAIGNLPLNTLPVSGLGAAQGVLDGTLSLSGPPDNPNAQWQATLGDLEKNYPQLTKPLALIMRGKLQQHALSTELSINAPDAESTATAAITMPMDVSLRPAALRFAPKGPISGDINADLILAPFLPLVMPDNLYGNGHVVAKLRLKGTLENPVVQGTASLRNGRLEIMQAGTLLDNITLTITAEDSRLTFSEGTATDGEKGTLAFDGMLDLTPDFPMDMKAQFSRFVALRHPNATATLSGETALTGDITDALLKGNWVVNTAKILIRRTGESVTELKVIEVDSLAAPLMQDIEENGRDKPRKQRRRERPFSRNLALDVNLKANDQIFLDGFGLNAELKGSANVTGTAAHPKLEGKMETVRGQWEFFDRTFTITRGEAIVSEQNLSAPLINIRAEAEAEDVLAIAQISGSTNSPKIEFSSIPVLPQDEVLSRVMFGRKLKNISPFQALQLANMLRSLSGKGGGEANPLSKLQGALGIDELKFGTGSGNGEDVTVGVGKYLHENVYLEVEGGAGENSGKVSVEVDLTPRISVETEARQNAESAVRLNYKYDY